MKVLLISPQGSNIYAKMKVGLPSLGIAYLAAVIRKKGHEVKIIDKSIEQTELIPKDFADFYLIGISADTQRHPKVVEIARMAKEAGKMVIMGGYHVTFLNKEALDTGLVDILIRNEDMVKRMVEAGAFQIFFGLESHSENTLDNYCKNVGNKEQDQVIKLLNKYGINIHGSFIIDDISETRGMAMQTAKWVQKVNPRVAQFSILTPYPGTALYNDVEREGLFLHKDWELYDALHTTVKTDGMTPDEVQKMLIKDYRMAYINKYRLFHPRKFSSAIVQRLNKLHARQGELKKLIKSIRFFGTFWMEMQRTKPKKLRIKMDKKNGKGGYQAIHLIENDDELKSQEEMLQSVDEPIDGKNQGGNKRLKKCDY